MKLHLSHHARMRCKQMGIRTKEVKHAGSDPEAMDYPAPVMYGHCRVLVSGRLALPYDPLDGTVITVLWKGEFDRDRRHVRVGPEG